MKKFSTSKTYIGTDNKRYSYHKKSGGMWIFYRISDKHGKGGGLCNFSEQEMNKLMLLEDK